MRKEDTLGKKGHFHINSPLAANALWMSALR